VTGEAEHAEAPSPNGAVVHPGNGRRPGTSQWRAQMAGVSGERGMGRWPRSI
jgi:hypothetical protein